VDLLGREPDKKPNNNALDYIMTVSGGVEQHRRQRRVTMSSLDDKVSVERSARGVVVIDTSHWAGSPMTLSPSVQ
jgi:hypothetical protein